MPLPRFQKLDAQKRRAILAAAAVEFGERGFAEASFNRVIERAGISKGAMYYYFADKDDLYATALDAAITEWLAFVGVPARASTPAAFWRACEQTYARSLAFMLGDPMNGALCLAITRARTRLEGHPALLELGRRTHEWTTALVRHGREIGAVRDDVPEALMVEVAMSLIEAGDRWIAARMPLPEREVGEIARTMVGMMRRVATRGRRT
ncbi:MAG: TetR/AcrR family transcriptional regulator [Polyangiaceae bacterium]|nr:TetR/AcrR family transcriptional regulator [Polyangiaceae bacterium]